MQINQNWNETNEFLSYITIVNILILGSSDFYRTQNQISINRLQMYFYNDDIDRTRLRKNFLSSQRAATLSSAISSFFHKIQIFKLYTLYTIQTLVVSQQTCYRLPHM